MKINKLTSLGILAGGIAHDFNNFLMAISGNLQLAQMEPENTPKYMKQMSAAINRASSLAQKLLTFSKGGAPVKETASIDEIVKETTDFILEGSKILPKYTIDKKLWLGEVDSGQISQVIQNLIENAKQAMPAGGHIEISIKNKKVHKWDDLPIKPGGYIQITIKDFGIGIPKQYLPLIFDPYFSTKESGHGLGLAITYFIIQKHEGFITAESEPGIGTTFFLYLPANKKLRRSVETKRVKDFNFDFQNRTVLIMEDNKEISEALSHYLKNCGFAVTETRNGSETLSVYEANLRKGKKIEMLIIDLTIPGGLGGLETMKQLQQIDPDVVGIVSSGYSNNPVMANPENYGFKGAIEKPFQFEQLFDLIKTLFVKHYGKERKK